MRLPLPLLLCFLIQQCVYASPPTKRSHSTHDYYVLEHNPSAAATLEECTRELGVELVEQVGELRNVWLVRSAKLVSTFSTVAGTDQVLRRFEDLAALSEHPTSLYPRAGVHAHAHRISSSIRHLSPQIPRQRIKRAPPPPTSEPSTPSEIIAEQLGFADPLFTKQWHIVNDQYPEHMMNVTGVWEMGFTGEGIITSLVDDGLDYQSRDLAGNFVRIKF